MSAGLQRVLFPGMFALAGCASVADTAPPAETPPRTSTAIFERIDRDGSGSIDPEEFRNAMTHRFGRLDANQDGVLLGDEIPVHGIVASHAGDAERITREDFQAAIPQTLERIDSNHDGALSLDEFRAVREEKQP